MFHLACRYCDTLWTRRINPLFTVLAGNRYFWNGLQGRMPRETLRHKTLAYNVDRNPNQYSFMSSRRTSKFTSTRVLVPWIFPPSKYPWTLILCTSRYPESNQVILVIELMDCNMKDYIESIKDTGIDFGDKVFICHGIASGLEYIHGRNIVHRDLCCVNILVNYMHPPLAKMSDFGISKLIDDDHLTTQTRLRDRNRYLPPEAFLSDRTAYNSSLDVFSYGVIVAQIACKVPVVEPAKDRDKIKEPSLISFDVVNEMNGILSSQRIISISIVISPVRGDCVCYDW